MSSEEPCGWCFTCQVCIECEAYAGRRRPTAQPIQQQQPILPPQPRPMPPPTPPITEERIRQIIIDVLIELGLIPEAKRRTSIEPTK